MFSPLKVAICEDSTDEKEKLMKIIEHSSIPAECDIFSCGEDFLAAFHPKDYDLILMDIYMDGMTGIEVISRVREFDADIPVAFITTSLDYTLESYRLNALKYIEKPYKQKDIDDIFNIALRQRENAPSLIIKKGTEYMKLYLSSILYLEQNSRQVYIHFTNGTQLEIYDKLTNLLSQLLCHDFFHSHKSYIANLAYVTAIDNELRCFVMTNGENVPIRRDSVHNAKEAFEDYLFNSVRR